MPKTMLFHSGRAQAVRLPKDVIFPDSVHSVTMQRDGARRVITPSEANWDEFFNAPGAA